jgi:hypothetical protein
MKGSEFPGNARTVIQDLKKEFLHAMMEQLGISLEELK